MGLVKILLDTCAFLWLALEPRRLSRAAAAALDDGDNDLHLSDASVFEIVMKHRTGKLPLPSAPRSWLPSRIAFFKVQPIRIEAEAIYRSGELPPVHADPFDRLLAAQALIGPFQFVTPDPPFRAYGVDCIW